MQITNTKDLKLTDNFRMMIYAKPGTGKTSTIKHLPGKTLVLDLDNSSKVLAGSDIDVIVFNRKDPINDMSAFLTELPKISKEYDNIVIDNISSFEKDWFVAKGKESKNGIANELQHYSIWTNYFLRVITAIYRADANILLTAWEKQFENNSDTGQTFMQYAPEIRDSVRNTIMGLTDVVGRMVAKPTGERGFILQGNDAVFAKNRLDKRTGCLAEELFNFEL